MEREDKKQIHFKTAFFKTRFFGEFRTKYGENGPFSRNSETKNGPFETKFRLRPKVWGRQPPPDKRFVARGSEPSARQKPSAAESGGVWGRQPLPEKRFDSRGSELSARRAGRCGKQGYGGSSPNLKSASLPAVASRLKDKPSAAESGGVGAAAPT
jgi:hypothetical protein